MGSAKPSIVYLDVDDEITSAAARIRSIEASRIALVLPAGSRLATSRINFRLLAREAVGHERELAIVAPEAGTRSLAASAGLPVFATVSEFEAAVAQGTAGPAAATNASVTRLPLERDGGRGTSIRTRANPRDPRAGGGIGPDDPTREFDGGTIVTLPRPREELDGWPPDEDVLDGRGGGGGGRGRRWIAVLIALLLVFAAVSGVGAYVLLPTAIVTVRAVPEQVGPLSLQITADPLAANVDPVKLVVPADIVTFDLEASEEFPATGVEVIDTAATGTLRWSNCDPTSAYTIRAGTRARTSAGVAFETTEELFLPVAGLSGGNPPTLTCQSRDVAARAVENGPAGNVPAGTISRVPSNLNAVVLRVTNPEATTGGEHTEKTLVTVEDVGAAQRALEAALKAQFDDLLKDPDRVPPGTEIIPETRASSEAEPVEDPVALIGQELESFELTYRATGTATAVRQADVVALADSLIRAEVAPDMALVRDSVRVDVGQGTPEGATVVYPVFAEAQQVGTIDAEAVREAIRGRSVGEARERLGDYGDAQLDVWPGWVTAIPTLDFRLEIRVVADVPTESNPPTTFSPPPPPGTPRPSATSASPAPSGS
jgi:hypothetical protein